MSGSRIAGTRAIRLLLIICLALAGSLGSANAEPSGAATPPMGWSTWYGLRCSFDAATLRTMADRMRETGLAAAGYDHLNVDDCWAVARDADGALAPDAKRFPQGLKPVTDYAHGAALFVLDPPSKGGDVRPPV